MTLLTGEDYVTGARALAKSLAMVESRYPLTALAVGDLPGLDELERLGVQIIRVEPLPVSRGFKRRHSKKGQALRAPFTKGNKPKFHDPLHNFIKLRLWEQTQFEKVVFLDADLIAVQNIDRLFDFPEFVAAPNLYESLSDFHRMNSGVFVAEPDQRTFEDMMVKLDQPRAFWRRTDQTFLESYFPAWDGLPYIYNTLQYVWFNMPKLWDWRRIRVIHYQYEKPWETDHPKREKLKPLIDLWWRIMEHGRLPDVLPEPILSSAET